MRRERDALLCVVDLLSLQSCLCSLCASMNTCMWVIHPTPLQMTSGIEKILPLLEHRHDRHPVSNNMNMFVVDLQCTELPVISELKWIDYIPSEQGSVCVCHSSHYPTAPHSKINQGTPNPPFFGISSLTFTGVVRCFFSPYLGLELMIIFYLLIC